MVQSALGEDESSGSAAAQLTVEDLKYLIHLQDMTTPCKKEIARILPFLGLMINIYRHDKYAAIQASYRSLP